jgi:hypothetical protein
MMQTQQAQADCPKLGAGWAWSHSQNSTAVGPLHWCRLCRPQLDQCVLKW